MNPFNKKKKFLFPLPVKTITWLGIVLFSFGAYGDIMPAAKQANTGPNSNPATSNGGLQRGGLQVQVKLRKTLFGEYEFIDVERVVKNISNQDIKLWSCGLWCNDKVVVKDVAGQEVKMHLGGVRARKAFENLAKDKNAPWNLAPSQTDSMDFELHDLFVLFQPGTYTLQMFYGQVPSNVVTFTIQKDESQEENTDKTETQKTKKKGIFSSTITQNLYNQIISFCPQESPINKQCQAIAYLYAETQMSRHSPLKYWKWAEGVNFCSFSGIYCTKDGISMNIGANIKSDALQNFMEKWPEKSSLVIKADHGSCLSLLSDNPHPKKSKKQIICAFSDPH